MKQEEVQIIKDDECSICLCSCTKPVRCKGPCRKSFCLKCAAEAKCQSDRCPHRCSSPFEVESIKLPYKCPFSPEECSGFLSSQQELKVHYLTCAHISVNKKQAEGNKLNYRCDKGDQLTFLSKQALEILYGDFWVSASVKCFQCNQEDLCRAICVKCSLKDKNNKVYCYECRVPPCTTQRCPLGHRIKRRKKISINRFCDFCNVPVGLMGDSIFGFCSCEFDLCQACHSKLPEKDERLPLKWNAKQLLPLSMIDDHSSEDSDWKE